jgi:hypothetical protein
LTHPTLSPATATDGERERAARKIGGGKRRGRGKTHRLSCDDPKVKLIIRPRIKLNNKKQFWDITDMK